MARRSVLLFEAHPVCWNVCSCVTGSPTGGMCVYSLSLSLSLSLSRICAIKQGTGRGASVQHGADQSADTPPPSLPPPPPPTLATNSSHESTYMRVGTKIYTTANSYSKFKHRTKLIGCEKGLTVFQYSCIKRS